MIRILLFISILMASFATTAYANDREAELRLPIADEKRVIAHYMTGMIPSREGETGWMDSTLYDSQGVMSALGGQYQTLPTISAIAGSVDQLPSMEDAALFEIRTAKLLGIDGFNFYYPLGPNEGFRQRYDRIIATFFDVAAKHDLDFKLTLCLSPNGQAQLTAIDKANIFGKHLRDLLARTNQSENWLRTPDGRLLIYTWLTDAMVANVWDGRQWEIRNEPERLREVAAAFEHMETVAGHDVAILYMLDQSHIPELVDETIRNFPAIYEWVKVGEEDLKRSREIAARCKAQGRTYIAEVHGDYYTSKVYPKGGHGLIFSRQRVLDIVREQGLAGIERHAQIVGLTQTFRDKLQLALDIDSPLINFTTWNDYPEGHHLAPEINHNFAFTVVLKDYLRRWRGGATRPDEDTVAVFFKKYASDVTPEPYNIPIKNKRAVGPAFADDGIEIITMLTAPARLHVEGHRPVNVRAGLTTTRLPMRDGPVIARVIRRGQVVAEVTSTEWITSNPYRTDRLTYAKSSAFEDYYKAVFGPLFGDDVMRHSSREYNRSTNR